VCVPSALGLKSRPKTRISPEARLAGKSGTFVKLKAASPVMEIL
jgi:hypothetical protein